MEFRVLYWLLLLPLGVPYSCNDENCYSWRSDKQCDISCNSGVCNYDSNADLTDGQSFDKFKFSDCFIPCLETCSKILLSNDVCDSQCNSSVCGFDLGTCGFCDKGCEA